MEEVKIFVLTWLELSKEEKEAYDQSLEQNQRAAEYNKKITEVQVSAYVRLEQEMKFKRFLSLKEKVKVFELDTKKMIECKNCKDISRFTIAEHNKL